MHQYIAVIHKDKTSAYGVHFPDVPGCYSAGDTLEKALSNAREALQLFAEDHTRLAAPRDLEAIRTDQKLVEDIAQGCTFAFIPFCST